MKSQTICYYDRSGELLKGYFFQLEIPFDTALSLRMEPDSKQWIVSDSANQEYGPEAYAEVCVDAEEIHGCTLDPSHVRYENSRVSWAELYGGDQLADFVRDCIGQSIVATENFSSQLLESGLRGLTAMEVPIRFSQSRLQKIPELRRLDFQGRHCVRRWKTRFPTPNECPRCRWGPVVCPACENVEYVCPECKLDLVGWTNKQHDRPFTAEIINDTDYIVEAHEWDGSDFFAERYITRRALQFLMKVHATPFIVKPCWANVERLSKDQLSVLQAM